MASTSQHNAGPAFFTRLYLGPHKLGLGLTHDQEYEMVEMIEMQTITPAADRHRPPSIHCPDTGTGAGFVSAVGSWLTTSSAVVSSVVQYLADDLEMSDSLGSGFTRLSLGASLVAEVSRVAAKAATSQAHSVVDAAVVSVRNKTSTSSAHVTVDTCQGRGCNGTCCSMAEMMTDANIQAAVDDLQEQELASTVQQPSSVKEPVVRHHSKREQRV